MAVSSSIQENSKATPLGAPEQAVAQFKEEVTSGATQAVDAVKHAAEDAAGAAKKAAESQISAGKNLAVESLGSVAHALRQTAGHLSADDNALGDYVTSAATRVDQVSSYLQTRTLSELISDVEGYARREPAVFLGGAFVVGLFGGRFLKSSAPVAQGKRGQGTPGNETTMRALPAYARPSPVPYQASQAYGTPAYWRAPEATSPSTDVSATVTTASAGGAKKASFAAPSDQGGDGKDTKSPGGSFASSHTGYGAKGVGEKDDAESSSAAFKSNKSPKSDGKVS